MNPSERPTKKLHPILVAFLGSFVGSALAVGGMVLISLGHGAASYGWTMFIILPMAIGIVVGSVSRSVLAAVVSVVVTLLVGFVLLLLGGLEGVVCILMASPLFFGFAFIGVLIGVGISRLARKRSGPRSHLALLPLVGLSAFFMTGQAENRFAGGIRVETITTTRVVQATPDQVWTRILVVDDVAGPKPFLLRIGLPVPKSCTMEGSGVGARRVCHFENGVIEEEVTDWEPGRRLDLRVVQSTVPGRHWLRFESACYEIEPCSPTETRLTRTTTISTQLRPGWYWHFFEAMGVQAEHRYLFDSLF